MYPAMMKHMVQALFCSQLLPWVSRICVYLDPVLSLDEEASTAVTFIEPTTRVINAQPETQSPSCPVNGSPTEKKTRLTRPEKSFTVTTVYNTNASRAMHKLRAKNRAAKAFKSSLSVGIDLLLANIIILPSTQTIES